MQHFRKTLLALTLVFGLLLFSFPSLTQAQVNHVVSNANLVHKKWLIETKVLAYHGKTLNSGRFGLGSKKQSILHTWGGPDVDNDYYIYFYERRIGFSFDSNYFVNYIESQDKRLQSITLKEVKSTYGKATREYDTEGVHILQYPAGKHQLRIETAIPSKSNPNPTISTVTIN